MVSDVPTYMKPKLRRRMPGGEVKARDLQLSSNIFREPSTWDIIETNFRVLIHNMLNFTFPEKGLGQVSAPHFEYDISRKMFLMSYSINRPNFIV